MPLASSAATPSRASARLSVSGSNTQARERAHVAQRGGEVAARVRDLVDERVGGIGAMSPAEALRQEAVLGLHVVEDDGDAAQRGGHREEPQRVTGGRRVDHDAGPRAGCGETAQLEEADQLVDAGKRQAQQRVDVVLVEIGPAPDDAPQRGCAAPRSIA